ncbi:hypothetical protein X729_06330 [Mesorhizobium sp. L103C131B0]|nr:hypothetical protein X749_04115 [Mesorhizobium sp. LNJC391B00]ESZ64774.1 hypothetical protein X729_06330 [Mesorhizobium sp. L103C131B0]
MAGRRFAIATNVGDRVLQPQARRAPHHLEPVGYRAVLLIVALRLAGHGHPSARKSLTDHASKAKAPGF